MLELRVSLDAQHRQIDAEVEAVLAAGRQGRWPDYRLRLAALRDGLLQHMAFEDEALFPGLERADASAVKALREEHARLRRHLEVLGAAAPEQDPEGCLAEVGDLAALLRAHHAAELALDPRYATRPIPLLALGETPPLDLRGLQPPEPIVRIFEALEAGDRAPVRVILPHEPLPLYSLLRERGYCWSGTARPDGGYELTIERS